MYIDNMAQIGPVLHEHMKRTVLVVDDEFINREILGSILEDNYNVMFAEDGQEAVDKVSSYSNDISVVLLDLIMPKINGQGVIRQMQSDEVLRRIPIIVMTSEKEAEVECLELGASDFIAKPYNAPAVILARVKRTIELSEDRSVISAMERDSLTRVLTREFFYEYIRVTKHFYKDKEMDAIVLNIDHFHLINEIYGRKLGDQILIAIAKTIYQYARQFEGTVARGEADTFYLYLRRQSDYKELLKQIDDSLHELSDTLHAHIRLGVYEQNEEQGENGVEEFFDRAKLACNSIRGNMQESIAHYDQSLQHNAVFRERLIHDMYEAIDSKQFMVYYQPKFAIQGKQPVLHGAEALIRWKHPEFGMVSPGEFISLFEENGLIQKVDHYVWRQVAEQVHKWKDAYAKMVPVSVNMSRIDAFDNGIVRWLDELLDEYRLQPADIHIEVTESAYSGESNQLIEVIEKLRADGFLIEMDDFGAGYSSLNMLGSLPIDVLKMDMKFLRDMHKDEKRLHMIELVMDIAGFLGVPVVAEGCENQEQFDFLKSVGCDMIQGYYFSRPVPAEEFEKMLKEYNEQEEV